MKGDFSRHTFDRQRHYRKVNPQQGRAQLDSDWNEKYDIYQYLLRTLARSLVVEENKGLVDVFVDAFNARDWDRVVNLHARSVVCWTPDNPEPKKGRAAIRDLFAGYVAAFPDAQNQKEQAFGQGDWVCAEYVFTGAHEGPLTAPDGKVVQGTRKHVRVPWVSMYKLAG
jgi:ketosteroid isomerase-like protein